MAKPKVFIYPGDSYHAAIKMFEQRGFEVVKDFEGVDLICFLGGTDVDPTVYGEERGPFTQSPDRARDDTEVAGYHKFLNVPKVGICRGGQLLNVLNNGGMIQHLGECISGDVEMVMIGSNAVRRVRVDHHQGMMARSAIRSKAYLDDSLHFPDYVVVYPETKSLCFQPHPEWGHKGTEDYFFELIEEHLGLKGI